MWFFSTALTLSLRKILFSLYIREAVLWWNFQSLWRELWLFTVPNKLKGPFRSLCPGQFSIVTIPFLFSFTFTGCVVSLVNFCWFPTSCFSLNSKSITLPYTFLLILNYHRHQELIYLKHSYTSPEEIWFLTNTADSQQSVVMVYCIKKSYTITWKAFCLLMINHRTYMLTVMDWLGLSVKTKLV